MRHLLNTLYVNAQGAYLRRDGETVEVRVEDSTALAVPVHTIGSIVCFGRVGLSTPLMDFCGERGVPIALLTEGGRFRARVAGPLSGNVLLRRAQYAVADSHLLSSGLARAIVVAKVINSRNTLRRALRDHPSETRKQQLGPRIERLGAILDHLAIPDIELDLIRGREGEAASLYFESFDQLITNDAEEFRFHHRSRRPPLDRVNALLSFFYSLLTHDVAGALESVGLDPAVGFLHRERPGRPSLALDLMEELRSFFADRLALSLINRRQLAPNDFVVRDNGTCQLTDPARKAVIIAYQKRKQEELIHPFIDETIPLGLIPHIQALLLARHLRGDLDAYPPFIAR
jgi:CRISPR-associated protein Cas1